MWEGTQEQDDFMKKLPPAISAPKMKLPGHNESYNPPDEYLMSEVTNYLNNISKNQIDLFVVLY